MTIHRINTVLAILLGTFVLPGQSFSECVEVGAGAMEDSYITYKSGGGINDQALDWGDRQKMLVGNFVNDAQFNADGTHDSSRDHAGVGVIKFDLSEIPENVSIDATTLSMTAIASEESVDFRLYPPAESWSEADVTWNNLTLSSYAHVDWALMQDASIYDSDAKPATALGTDSQSRADHSVSFDVTGMAAYWMQVENNGLLLEKVSMGPGFVRIRSSEYAHASKRPKMTVCYSEQPAVVCDETNPAIHHGTGSIIDRYLICSAAHLASIGTFSEYGWSSYLDKHLRQVADIDASSIQSSRPIGDSYGAFTGGCDGPDLRPPIRR